MPTLDLPDTANPGDPGHDTDHNKIVTAIIAINDYITAGVGSPPDSADNVIAVQVFS